MGYTSTVVIAVRKDTYLKCQLLQNIPRALMELTVTAHDKAVYWEIDGWKWYQGYPEIEEIEAWFDWLTDMDENPEPLETYNGAAFPVPVFGALRMGEDMGDIQDWGDPGHFDINPNQSISVPF